MNSEERRAAAELDRLLSSLQGRDPPVPAQNVDRQDAHLAARLVQLSKATRLEPEVAARIEAQLKQIRPWEQRPRLARWQSILNCLAGICGLPLHRPLLVILLTMLLTVASFALFSRLSSPVALAPQLTPVPPARPHAFEDYGPAILSFLNAQPDNAAAVKALLASWGAPLTTAPSTATWEAGGDVLSADVDRNGEEDLIVALPNPEYPARDGVHLLFLKQAGLWHLSSEARHQPLPKLLYEGDLLADGRMEIVRSTAECTAAACSVAVDVLRWENGALRSLQAGLARMDYPDVTIADSTQPAKELRLHGGVNRAPGAGPQRASTAVYRWNGTAFALAETRPDASDYRYFKVIDANEQMLQGNYSAAAALYQEAATNTRLRAWEAHDPEQERADLQAFSRFRAMVALSLLRQESRAQVWRDYVLIEQARHIYAQVTTLFWQSYAPNRSVAEGCRSVTAFAAITPAVPGVLNNFGFGNAGFNADDVCPFK